MKNFLLACSARHHVRFFLYSGATCRSAEGAAVSSSRLMMKIMKSPGISFWDTLPTTSHSQQPVVNCWLLPSEPGGSAHFQPVELPVHPGHTSPPAKWAGCVRQSQRPGGDEGFGSHKFCSFSICLVSKWGKPQLFKEFSEHQSAIAEILMFH